MMRMSGQRKRADFKGSDALPRRSIRFISTSDGALAEIEVYPSASESPWGQTEFPPSPPPSRSFLAGRWQVTLTALEKAKTMAGDSNGLMRVQRTAIPDDPASRISQELLGTQPAITDLLVHNPVIGLGLPDRHWAPGTTRGPLFLWKDL